MTSLDAETVWRMPKKELVSLIMSGAFPNRTGKIRFYAPSFVYYKNKYFRSSHDTFPSISITGSSCALKCKHCNGKVLGTMVPAMTPEGLFDVCAKLKNDGAVGCLISGGCLPDGSVPLDKFIDSIAQIKRELGLTVIVHTGVIDFSTAKRLKTAGVDAALIDIIGSDETIREVYHLDVSVADYERSLRAFHESGIPFVPHVLVGLHYGELRGELEALKIISKYSPSAVITIAFMPIRGTPMEKVSPPEPEDIVKILASARLLMPETPIVLGCMRPKGEHRKRTDTLAVRAGVNAIAFPVEEAILLAKSLKLETSFSSLCCSQIFEDIKH
jgi:uncharacterized radical SAM superfamily protein